MDDLHLSNINDELVTDGHHSKAFIENPAVLAAGAKPLQQIQMSMEILMQMAMPVMPLHLMLFGVSAEIMIALCPPQMQLTCPNSAMLV